MVTAILNFLGLILIIKWLAEKTAEFRNTTEKKSFFSFKRFKNGILLFAVIGIPLLLVNVIIPIPKNWGYLTILSEPNAVLIVSVVLAFLISGVWLMYVRKLDIYEPERWIYISITFIFSGLITWFLVGDMYSLASSLGFTYSDYDPVIPGFLKTVFIIGGIEELAKLIPVLLILLVFRKAINEPYDYILYGSVSALGFAFVENIMYINWSSLYNVGGRALYAAVAHMTFSSIACYGLMLRKFRLGSKSIFVVVFYFFFAMLCHGFYDFWIINYMVSNLYWITTIFFLITIHIWFTLKNNAINVSNFYSPDIQLNNDKLRTYLILSLTGLLMLAYVIVALKAGTLDAWKYLYDELTSYGYLVFYLAFGLSRYQIIPNQINPLQIPFDFFIPKPVKRNVREEV